MYYHVDGKLVAESEATVSVRDRGFMYGDAGFETLRAYAGTPFEWEAHRERLASTCETLGFGIPSDLRERVMETLDANDLADAYVRLSVTRGVQPGKLTPEDDVDPTVVVIVSELPRGGTEGERVWDGPATVSTAETRRVPETAIPATAKTHNYLNGILARLEADEADEALLMSTDWNLTEGATSNLFLVDDGQLLTPTTDLPILPGITRRVVLELADESDLSVERGRFEPAVLDEVEEVFLTNSTWEIRPVAVVDDREFEVGPVTRTLQRAFDERVDQLY